MKRIFVFIALVGLLASPLSATDLADFRILHKSLPNYQEDSGRAFMNELQLPFLREPIPLARTQILLEDDGREVTIGFDPDSLRLEWLIPSQVLWVHWGTFSQGTGGFNFHGNLLLDVRYGFWREIFRDFFMSYARGGWWHTQAAKLDFTFDPRLNLLTMTFEAEHFHLEKKKPTCYAEMKVERVKGTPWYEYVWRERDVRTYQLIGGKLSYLSGYSVAELDKKGFTPKVLAKQLDISEAALKVMNPQLKARKKWAGWVVVNSSLPPYRSKIDDDGLSGGL